MSQIHVITNTGNPLFNMVLAGVYGEFSNETSKFRVAPEFYPISPLFNYFDRHGMPILRQSIATLNAPEGKLNLMQAQLLLNLAMRWQGLYEANADRVQDMAAAMTHMDEHMVSNGVRNHLITMGMRGFIVPM